MRKPPAIPRIATAIAFRRTASRNATAVISAIKRNVGTNPKNAKW